ncbi:MAG: Rieske 2Fe-2S domain-containing protein [Actinobacteria bacterium]|nr:Rieske 2Fe-2S domain-containing protein [Actinomycetota bacterium]
MRGEASEQEGGAAVRHRHTKDVLSGAWLGHPLHPMLTDVSIGAWASAVVLDPGGSRHGHQASERLIRLGLLAALPTAASGLSDWSDDPGAPRRIGVVHATANATAVACYSLSLLARRRGQRTQGLAWSLVGAVAVGVGGYLGGHLSFAKGVNVNRNAWQEEVWGWTPVPDHVDLPEDEPVTAHADEVRVLLIRRDEHIYAIADRCGHAGGPLHKGRFEAGAWSARGTSVPSASITADWSTDRQPFLSPPAKLGLKTERSSSGQRSAANGVPVTQSMPDSESGPCLRYALAGQPLALRGKILDVLTLRLAALAAIVGMLRPGAAVTAPALARVELFRHEIPSVPLRSASNDTEVVDQNDYGPAPTPSYTTSVDANRPWCQEWHTSERVASSFGPWSTRPLVWIGPRRGCPPLASTDQESCPGRAERASTSGLCAIEGSDFTKASVVCIGYALDEFDPTKTAPNWRQIRLSFTSLSVECDNGDAFEEMWSVAFGLTATSSRES